MPIFEYKCDKCGKVAEFLEQAGSRKKRSCPACGGEKLSKLISVFSPGIKEGQSKRCHGCSDNVCPHATN